MKQRLKTQLTLSIAAIVLLTVGLISFLSNIFIYQQFENYKTDQQTKSIQEITDQLSSKYNAASNKWDIDFVHAIGMTALDNGYIIKVLDTSNQIIWDAKSCDMMACNKVMANITKLMTEQYPHSQGSFTNKTVPIVKDAKQIGTVIMSFYGPYFFSENDFNFLNSLNTLLIIIGICSLVISAFIGALIARRISRPILISARITKDIASGDYSARIHESTGILEVNELMSSVNHLAESLSHQENLRKQLTADVAHELRTPITTLQTHMEAMTLGLWEPTPARLQSCQDEILRIGKLIADLESVTKIENDRILHKTQMNLKEIAEKVITTFELEIKKKHLDAVLLGSCCDIAGDEDRLRQVIINLVSNAIKYTLPGGKIILTFGQTSESVTLSIKDNGIGISEGDLPYIFERFYRVDKSRNRMTGGTGIGLTIVKSMVDAHNGNISVTSHPGEGSEFIITLPISPLSLAAEFPS